ncbi:aldehyde dehydrogenase family protein [Nocardia otitidiscaviarum]|uniref:aldehyde dehydrogenase family protein n=1 Tax=Nocardia otitidiscaviarum TaxID=1823 RepID=UPI001895510A|nr:aldehyde dehydrogenase family protein [Nocardia otitidiscaviarum]MBF6182178.1 aldehyde dehydrogenase family protein [Nocardia otitidiscaviarum]
MSFFRKHLDLLESAVAANRTRTAWTGFAPIAPPTPARAAEFIAGYDGATLHLAAPTSGTLTAAETSPYTGKPLNVTYSAPTADEAMAAAAAAAPELRAADAERRVGVCLEALARIHERGAEFAAVTSHTTGQSLNMACTGSGTNALDRGLEGVAMAWAALRRVPESVTWQATFGSTPVTLRKRFRARPLGTALVIACASFPAWNAYPAILVNLATGNPVLVKPHPHSILATALAVGVLRDVLREADLPADAVQLVVDTVADPIAGRLATDSATRIIDFTGSPAFGSWLEKNCRHALVYTETAGVNTVLLDSVHDLPATIRTLAGGLSLFSGQMCTTPQNIYLPDAGVRTDTGTVSRDEVVAALRTALDELADAPRRAAAVCGALQSDSTLASLRAMADDAERDGTLVRPPTPYAHPHHPDARVATPMLVRLDPRRGDTVPDGEQFGPVAFLIDCADTAAAVAHATAAVRAHGAISSYLYCTDDAVIDEIADAYAEAGASLSANLVSSMPMQYAAAYSDYHVTGLNPAGNATLTDESFVSGRFRMVQDRRQVVN